MRKLGHGLERFVQKSQTNCHVMVVGGGLFKVSSSKFERGYCVDDLALVTVRDGNSHEYLVTIQ